MASKAARVYARTRSQALARWRTECRSLAILALVEQGGWVTATWLARRLGLSAHGLRPLLEGDPFFELSHTNVTHPSGRRGSREVLTVPLVPGRPEAEALPGVPVERITKGNGHE